MMENSILAGIQAQWLRMHNFFAHHLSNLRPEWKSNDRTLYEEARKILSAIHQHYTYTEWLPILIGKQTTDLYLKDKNVFSQYNPKV